MRFLLALFISLSCLPSFGQPTMLTVNGLSHFRPRTVPNYCSDFSLVASSGNWANGTSTPQVTLDTTGAKLYCVMTENGQTGAGTLIDDAGNTYVGLTPQSFQRPDGTAAWQTNRIYYSLNPITSNSLTISFAGTNSAFYFFAFSCSGSAVFDGQSAGATITSGDTIQPGSLTPHGTEFLFTGVGWWSTASASIDSGFIYSSYLTGGGFVAGAFTNSTTAQNPTWTLAGPDNIANASMAMFHSSTCGGGGGGDTIFITGGHGSTLRDNFSGKIGYSFTVGASSITVTHLGLLKVSGNTHTHVVSIYDSVGIIATATIDFSTGSPGDYNWQSVTPVSLSAGVTYDIAATYSNGGGDQWYNDDANVTSTADGTVVNSSFSSGTPPPFSNGTTGTRSFAVPNFQYTKP